MEDWVRKDFDYLGNVVWVFLNVFDKYGQWEETVGGDLLWNENWLFVENIINANMERENYHKM